MSSPRTGGHIILHPFDCRKQFRQRIRTEMIKPLEEVVKGLD